MIDATRINSIGNPRHYTMMNTIRDKQTLIEVLNEKETYKYPLFILLKCESIDVWKWLKSLGLNKYYESLICNGYCDLSCFNNWK